MTATPRLTLSELQDRYQQASAAGDRVAKATIGALIARLS